MRTATVHQKRSAALGGNKYIRTKLESNNHKADFRGTRPVPNDSNILKKKKKERRDEIGMP